MCSFLYNIFVSKNAIHLVYTCVIEEFDATIAFVNVNPYAGTSGTERTHDRIRHPPKS